MGKRGRKTRQLAREVREKAEVKKKVKQRSEKLISSMRDFQKCGIVKLDEKSFAVTERTKDDIANIIKAYFWMKPEPGWEFVVPMRESVLDRGRIAEIKLGFRQDLVSICMSAIGLSVIKKRGSDAMKRDITGPLSVLMAIIETANPELRGYIEDLENNTGETIVHPFGEGSKRLDSPAKDLKSKMFGLSV